MGATYAISPLTEEARRWLRDEHIAFPDSPSRWPTHAELRSLLDSLSGHSVTYRDTAEGRWDAQVVTSEGNPAAWAMADIWVKSAPDRDTPTEFSFHKPAIELALIILERVVRVCGPFLLLDGSSGRAIVVAADADIPRLIAQLFGSAGAAESP